MPGSRNADILRHIVAYCDEIFSAVNRFGADRATFMNDSVYKNAVALCLLQIGELTTHLTDEFKVTYSDIPWGQIKGLRNVVAHSYGKIDAKILWETVEDDIPTLHKHCIEIMEQFSAIEQGPLRENGEPTMNL